MSLYNKLALFVGGTLFGSVGIKLLSSKDAKKAYVHVLLGKHADTGNVVRNQTAHAGDSAVLTSMYSAMRRS